MKSPVRIAVTGAAGQISYALLFRIAAGEMLGSDQPIILNLVEIPQAMSALNGVLMELEDCAFPLLKGVNIFSDANEAFKDIDYAILVGAKPRGKGMERADLLASNANIFKAQGAALNAHAKRTVKVLVVGNPANTNCLVAQRNAPDIAATQFTAMTMLDHNRTLAQLANKTGSSIADIQEVCIWGNHSATQVPDITNAIISGKSVFADIDPAWYEETFIPTIQERGAAIIQARSLSSAASAANAAIDHMKHWALGCQHTISMAVCSSGEYGITPGLIFSYPVTCAGGSWSVKQGVSMSPIIEKRLKITHQELIDEQKAVESLLQ